jgi:hypothetical protein
VRRDVGRRIIVLERGNSRLPIGRDAFLCLRDERDIGLSGGSWVGRDIAPILRGWGNLIQYPDPAPSGPKSVTDGSYAERLLSQLEALRMRYALMLTE